ncbi:MAG: protoporphyrinogen oxidase HemJ [Alphaproteobacteria bacterium]
MNFLMIYYSWLKALHIIAVIAWMAGMLYLPRLFVYHSTAAKGSELSKTFKIMERRLFKFIMTPAMLAAFLFGALMLAANPTLMSEPWMHAKLGLVFLMAGAHGFFAGCVKKFARDENTRSAKFYRIINEIPTVLLIAIVILVVVKPL